MVDSLYLLFLNRQWNLFFQIFQFFLLNENISKPKSAK
ncbi:hypothetical protein LEP1GSC188_4962 [Leptospira weilii serovar Topaz str. LT2116]|uniref:Uncharacterized protein n=1 Tax=Leptospira weilii serovar Topaz str. LT2116 TaxID=1088540 RepID=M3G651_9LEPT|nr:hypothetical protein LEP1GSC188_4962 [Leptospira weilii serovar Topaz str. LT2116]